MNENEHVVIALYPDKKTADETVENLKQWDRAHDDIKLGAIGTIYMEDGEVKSHVPHKVGRGATVGAIVGITVGVLTGPIGLVGGALAGAVAGGALGTFFKQSLNLTEEVIAGLGNDLQAGKVAIVVNCDDYEVTPTESILQYHGGEVKTYQVPAEAVREAAEAME